MDVEFVIATQDHPAGTGLSNGEVAVTFGTHFLNGSDEDLTWSGYMNVVVRPEGGTLGYSPRPGYPGLGWTVVLNTWAFGSGTGCAGYVPGVPQQGSQQTGINKGRTLTHELGHFFNLDHTFNGCGTNCNNSGDRVCDTPASNNAQYECPLPGSINGCVSGQKVLTMNYMDYTDDACMYMFTPGQATRMLAHYNSIKNQFSTTTLSNETFLENQFSIYPNPNKGSFTIEFKELANSFSVEVYDVTGKTIFENNYDQSANPSQMINLDNVNRGIYFINVKSDKGLVTKKLVIE
jgi:hypothetical protein